VVDNAFAGLGFSPEAAKYVFPTDMFLAEGDLSPIKENIDKIVYGLTKWEPKVKAKRVLTPKDKFMVHGADYEDLFANVNELFYKNLWTDGLPIFPPTERRVKWMLEGTDLSPDKVIAENVLPGGGRTQ